MRFFINVLGIVVILFVSVHKLLPDFQSAYRAQQTAVLKVLTDILTAADRGDLSMLTLLDLSAAFDTVDHAILLRRLTTSYGFRAGFKGGWAGGPGPRPPTNKGPPPNPSYFIFGSIDADSSCLYTSTTYASLTPRINLLPYFNASCMYYMYVCSSSTSLLAGVKAGRVHLCRVAGNTA